MLHGRFAVRLPWELSFAIAMSKGMEGLGMASVWGVFCCIGFEGLQLGEEGLHFVLNCLADDVSCIASSKSRFLDLVYFRCWWVWLLRLASSFAVWVASSFWKNRTTVATRKILMRSHARVVWRFLSGSSIFSFILLTSSPRWQYNAVTTYSLEMKGKWENKLIKMCMFVHLQIKAPFSCIFIPSIQLSFSEIDASMARRFSANMTMNFSISSVWNFVSAISCSAFAISNALRILMCSWW